MTAINKLEESYLRHILLAVEVHDSSAPFRTFFDSWFAFAVGGPFLNANSRPHWLNNPCPDRHGSALRSAHFVSEQAARTLARMDNERLVKDHAIPVAILREMLFETRPDSVSKLRSFLKRFYRIGIITRREDDRLTAMGLKSKMPVGWIPERSAFLRYDRCSIISQDMGENDRVVRSVCSVKLAASDESRVSSWLLGTAFSKLNWNAGRDG